MTVIAIATLSDWLRRLAPVFNQWEAKPKPIAPCTRHFSRALSELQIISRNYDWFIALFAPVVIGRGDCLGLGFSTFENRSIVLWKCLLLKLNLHFLPVWPLWNISFPWFFSFRQLSKSDNWKNTGIKSGNAMTSTWSCQMRNWRKNERKFVRLTRWKEIISTNRWIAVIHKSWFL